MRQEVVQRERSIGRPMGKVPQKTGLTRRAGRLIRYRQHITAEPLGRFVQLVDAPPFHRCSRGISLKAAAAARSMLVAVVVMMLMRDEPA